MATPLVSEFKPVDGTHEFTIVGYSLSVFFGPGYSVNSETFKVGDHSWSIAFYPRGRDRYASAAAVSIYLNLVDGVRNGIFKFRMTLLDQRVDSLAHFTLSQGYCQMFDPIESEWGWPSFIRVPELESSSKYLKQDCIRIRCYVTIVSPPTPTPTPTAGGSHSQGESIIHVRSSSSISEDFERLLEIGSGCDVTLVVGYREFNAHKFILAARSPFFNALFFGPFSDPNLSRVPIPDMDPDAFKGLLHFIYCDKLSGEISDYEYRSLSDAADTYGFTRLKGDLRSPIKKSNKLCNLPYVTKSHIYEEQSD